MTTPRLFAYDSQLAAMPSVVAELLAQPIAAALDPLQPILFAGIGTSLHAAKVAADWVCRATDGRVRAFAYDAHDLGCGAVPILAGDQVVVISHRGSKLFPNASLSRARALGCRTVAIVGKAAPVQDADVTITTCANESAGTFSVSYLASLTVLARLVVATFPSHTAAFANSLSTLPAAVEATMRAPIAPAWIEGFARDTPILISGFGPDLPTAQEAALKLKEGAWLWTEAMSPEFALHGTPASYHGGMSAIVIVPGLDDAGRSQLLVDVLKDLGCRSVARCGPGEAEIGFAAPAHEFLRPFLAILPFHKLTAELARHRGTDPDTLHGHRQPWQTIMTGLRL